MTGIVPSPSDARYQTLFDSIDEGFCIIEFVDGPAGPLSDYVHTAANAAYALNTGIPNVVGQRVREMVPDEADGWVKLYVEVLKTGKPIRFERELVATQRFLELAAFRVEPASRREVAVLFKDVTERKRAERALQELNETLEARVAAALAERKVLADIVEGTNEFVQVVDLDARWVAINGAATREFKKLFGVTPKSARGCSTCSTSIRAIARRCSGSGRVRSMEKTSRRSSRWVRTRRGGTMKCT